MPNGDECTVLESHVENVKDLEEELPECRHFSYVNGISTKIGGGIHVNAWRDAIISAFVRVFNARPPKGGKKGVVTKTTAKKVYPYLTFFIRTEVDKPKFSSQTLSSQYFSRVSIQQEP
mgnify:CR=1 FL=1